MPKIPSQTCKIIKVPANGMIIDDESGQEIESIADQILPDFHNFLSAASEIHGSKLDWWVCSFSSRNCFTSPLFLNLLSLFLVKKKLDRSDNICIETDSIFLARTMRKAIGNLKSNTSQVRLSINFKDFVKPIFLFLAVFFGSLPFFLSTLFLSKKKIEIPDSPIVLLSCYAKPDWWERDTARYFNGLTERLSEKQKQNLYFFPRNFGLLNPFVIRRANDSYRRGEKNVLILEDFITVSDCFFAWMFLLRSLVRSPNIPKWHGIDVNMLYYKENLAPAPLFLSMQSVLHYRFFKRLKQRGVVVERFLNFHENQVNDKAMHLAIRHHFADAKNFGYQGFSPATKFYCSLPTDYENFWGVLPDLIAVPGSGYPAHVAQFSKTINLVVVPHFRASKINSHLSKGPNHTSRDQILVALPHLYSDWPSFLSLAQKLRSACRLSTSIIIVPHPAVDGQKLAQFKKKFGKGLFWSKTDIHELICQSRLLITGCSGTLIESIALGVPVVILKDPENFLYNPIPDSISKKFWQALTPEEVLNSKLLQKDQATPASTTVRGDPPDIAEQFFYETTSQSFAKFHEFLYGT